MTRRTLITAAALIFAASVGQSYAFPCHHFTRWYYPWPQPSCRAQIKPPPIAPDSTRSYYVEITTPPPDSNLDPDLAEHNAALATHHDEINQMIIILHTEEDAAEAAGRLN